MWYRGNDWNEGLCLGFVSVKQIVRRYSWFGWCIWSLSFKKYTIIGICAVKILVLIILLIGCVPYKRGRKVKVRKGSASFKKIVNEPNGRLQQQEKQWHPSKTQTDSGMGKVRKINLFWRIFSSWQYTIPKNIFAFIEFCLNIFSL